MISQGKTTDEHYHPGLRIYDKVLSDISRERPLTGEGYRVLLCLLGNVGSRNRIPGPAKIAEVLGLHQQNVWRHYQQMVEDGYLVKDEDGYRIHPFICWRGSESRRTDEISNLLVSRLT